MENIQIPICCHSVFDSLKLQYSSLALKVVIIERTRYEYDLQRMWSARMLPTDIFRSLLVWYSWYPRSWTRFAHTTQIFEFDQSIIFFISVKVDLHPLWSAKVLPTNFFQNELDLASLVPTLLEQYENWLPPFLKIFSFVFALLLGNGLVSIVLLKISPAYEISKLLGEGCL